MNARALNALAGVICRAQEQDRSPMGIAIRIESAGMLMSPEAAAAMASIARDARGLAAEAQLFRERIAEQESEIVRLGERIADLEAAAAQRLAADFEAMRVALLANSHPELAHAALDADDDTAFPLPGVAHPKAEGRAS